MERSGKIYFYLYDGHGSVRGLIDTEGNITDTYCYDAFGNLLGKTGSTENSYLYCGEQQDDTTGLYYLRARYMNPATGTFTSMDTYGGSVFDPTSLHKYLYANANPVMNVDPSGYATERVADYGIGMTIMGIMAEASTAAASFALNFFYSFMAALPTIMAAATGFAAILINNPAFIDICSMFANGDITIWDLRNQIIETFNEIKENTINWINNRANNVSNNTSGSNGNGGNSGSAGAPDPNKWKDLIVKAGKNIKTHYRDHKKILEEFLGKKYPKWKESNNGEEFLNDIQKLINDGTVKYEGIGTLKAGQPDMMIFRGEGMTIVTKLDGEWVTLLESGTGMDLGIMMK